MWQTAHHICSYPPPPRPFFSSCFIHIFIFRTLLLLKNLYKTSGRTKWTLMRCPCHPLSCSTSSRKMRPSVHSIPSGAATLSSPIPSPPINPKSCTRSSTMYDIFSFFFFFEQPHPFLLSHPAYQLTSYNRISTM